MACNTSDLYKVAINKSSRVTFVDGELVTKKGVRIPIKNEVIDTNSFYITNQCVSSDAFAFGSVFAAEAGITLKTNVDRYSLYDSEIKLYFNILLENNTYEKIPLGKFYVNEPNRVGKNIVIKAYDGMIKLEQTIEESTTGTAYDLLSLVAERCDIELAQSETEVSSLINGDILLSVAVDRIDTYRDLVSYISQITCTFAIFDREGRLKLCEYGTSPVKKIEAKWRTSSKFSDFESFFSSAKAFFVNNNVYKGYVYTDPENKEGLLYDAGEIPLVQGLDETNQTVIDNIYSKLANIRYVPCEITFNGDPSLELGDMIVNVDRFGNEITSIITFYKWSYRAGHQIKSAGSNPKLSSVKEKKNKDLANMQAEINSKIVPIYTYTNSKSYSIKGGTSIFDMEDIIQISFGVNEDTTSLFMTTIQFEMNVDGFVEFGLFFDNSYYENSTICQYCHAGKNVITFMNYLACKQAKTYRLSVKARTYYEETLLRVNTAKIATNENARHATINSYKELVRVLKTSLPFTNISDTITYTTVNPSDEIPQMTIDKFNIKAVIFGQGLAGTPKWDGTIAFAEQLSMIPVGELDIVDFDEQVRLDKFTVKSSSILENLEYTPIESLPLLDINDSISFSATVTNHTIDTDNANNYIYDNDYIVSDNGFMLQTNYIYKSSVYEFTEGKMCGIKIKTSDKASVEGLEVKV